MFPLDWLLAIAAVVVFMSGLGATFCLKCFWQMKGGLPIELLASLNIWIFLLSFIAAMMLVVASTYLTFGWVGIASALATFALLVLARKALRYRRPYPHRAW